MHAYIYAYIHICTHAYIQAYINTGVRTCKCVYDLFFLKYLKNILNH